MCVVCMFCLCVCSCVCVASCLSWVPEQGTVGACGDLAPLAHLSLGLMGEGLMWSPQSGWADAKAVSTPHILYITTHAVQ